VTTLATIIIGLITAAATIAAALIIAHTPKREIHEVVIRGLTEPEKSSPFSQVVRLIGSVIIGAMILIGFVLINLSVIMWLDPSYEVPDRKLLTALFLVSAALLFCICRWISNRLPDPLRSEADEDD
jgi:hypothetical protein